MLFVIPKVVALVVTAIFAFATDAASGWKLVLVVLVILSLFLQHRLSSDWAYMAGLLIQVAVSIGLLIYFKLR